MTPMPLRALSAFALLALVQCDCEPDAPNAVETEAVEGEHVAAPNGAVIPAAEVPWENVEFPAPAGALGLDLSPSTDGLVATWVEPELHRVRLSRFDGEWSAPVTVAEDEALVANWADFPRSAEGGDGALYVNAMFQAGSAPYAYEVRLFRSTDAIHFAPLGVLHRDGTETEHGFVSMAVTEDGVQVYWLDGRGNVDDGFTAVYSAAVHGEARARASPPDLWRRWSSTGTARATRSPHLCVGYRGADVQIRRLSVDALPRGQATGPVDTALPVKVGATLGAGAHLQGHDGEQLSLADTAAEAIAERPLVLAFFARVSLAAKSSLPLRA